MVTELGPLITGLMVAGRNASGMASELGSMIVDRADRCHARPGPPNPTKKLITPRIGATASCSFFWTIIAGPARADRRLWGGASAVRARHAAVLTSVWQTLVFRDVFTGLIKPVLFGFHHFDRRLLLRHVDARRDPGSRTIHDPGRGRFLGADSGGGFLRDQVDLRDLWVQVSHARSHSAQREHGGPAVVSPSDYAIEFENVFHCVRLTMWCSTAFSFRLAHGETKAVVRRRWFWQEHSAQTRHRTV